MVVKAPKLANQSADQGATQQRATELNENIFFLDWPSKILGVAFVISFFNINILKTNIADKMEIFK